MRGCGMAEPLSPCCGDYKRDGLGYCALCPVKPKRPDEPCGGCGYYTCECPDRSRRNDSVLDEAARLVDGDRQQAYGRPADNHACTAAMWRAYLDRRMAAHRETKLVTVEPFYLDGFDVAMLNILQKVSRLAHSRHRDGLTDICGYAANAERVEEGS